MNFISKNFTKVIHTLFTTCSYENNGGWAKKILTLALETNKLRIPRLDWIDGHIS